MDEHKSQTKNRNRRCWGTAIRTNHLLCFFSFLFNVSIVKRVISFQLEAIKRTTERSTSKQSRFPIGFWDAGKKNDRTSAGSLKNGVLHRSDFCYHFKFPFRFFFQRSRARALQRQTSCLVLFLRYQKFRVVCGRQRESHQFWNSVLFHDATERAVGYGGTMTRHHGTFIACWK